MAQYLIIDVCVGFDSQGDMFVYIDITHYLTDKGNIYWYVEGLSHQRFSQSLILHLVIIKPPAQVVGGGILVSLRLSICPSVRPSVRPAFPCPLCSAYNSGWIIFIFTHLIKQLQKVHHV